ncbi:hypothetical protein JOD54_000892 [Actinokineospora baliensis]|uniref:DUF3558 family protein n=1 Tax=Actinokineospora baliensis TaxID=547056 RepID=UPI00195DCCE5|nr:DUF3558 family protein [Actinokineospora baliensis]MBM7770688.1 hypothetical protein [Actinokineospora baliensis]
MRRIGLLVLAAALAASGCTSKEAGSPTPSGGTPADTTTTAGPTTRPPKTTGSTSPAQALKPCDLLTPAAAKSLGVTSGPEEVDLGKLPFCEWRVDKGSIADSFTFGVLVLDNKGLDDIVAEGAVQRIKVGSRDAAQSISGGGGVCAISLELSAKSRVDVQATGGDGSKLCAPALEAAKLVEPELP